MTPQLWATVVVAAVGIALQGVAAYIVVRVSVAVLEERFNGHRDVTRERFAAHERRIADNQAEVERVRTRVHDHANRLQEHDGRIRQIESVVGKHT